MRCMMHSDAFNMGFYVGFIKEAGHRNGLEEGDPHICDYYIHKAQQGDLAAQAVCKKYKMSWRPEHADAARRERAARVAAWPDIEARLKREMHRGTQEENEQIRREAAEERARRQGGDASKAGGPPPPPPGPDPHRSPPPPGPDPHRSPPPPGPDPHRTNNERQGRDEEFRRRQEERERASREARASRGRERAAPPPPPPPPPPPSGGPAGRSASDWARRAARSPVAHGVAGAGLAASLYYMLNSKRDEGKRPKQKPNDQAAWQQNRPWGSSW